MRLTIDGVQIEWDHLAGAGKMIGNTAQALHVCRCVLEKSISQHGKISRADAENALRHIRKEEGR